MKYAEKLLLALYLEFFDEYYKVFDERTNKDGLVRHTEMQNLVLLVQNLGVTQLHYNFMMDFAGPISSGIQALLLKMDFKEAEIFAYYKNYVLERNQFYPSYQSQLNYLFSKSFSSEQIKRLAIASYVLKDILKWENGSQALASLIYISRNVLPHEDFDEILAYLEKNGYSYDFDLLQEIWHTMAILGLRFMESKKKDFSLHSLKRKKD